MDCFVSGAYRGVSQLIIAAKELYYGSPNLEFVAQSLQCILDDPFEEMADSRSGQFIHSILSTRQNQGSGFYRCPIHIDGNDFTLHQEPASSELTISTNTNPPETMLLPNVMMGELKKVVIVHFLASEKRLGALLLDQFSQMEKENSPVRAMLILSRNHAMAASAHLSKSR